MLCGNHRGRPRLDIKPEQLEYLLHLGFQCSKIAEVMGVSLSTIRRRMSEFGLSVTALYSSVTDHELDVIVSQIQHEFPNCGYHLMHGHLVCRGHRVSQARIRESMHRVNPEGVALRWISAVQRRKYVDKVRCMLYNTKCLFQGGGLWFMEGTQGYLSICTAQVIIGHTLF